MLDGGCDPGLFHLANARISKQFRKVSPAGSSELRLVLDIRVELVRGLPEH